MNPFYLPNKLRSSKDIIPCWCRRLVYDRARSEFEPSIFTSSDLEQRVIISPHFHEIFEFICLRSGQLDFTVNKSSRRMNPGDIALIAPFYTHIGKIELTSSTVYDCIQFDRSCLNMPGDTCKKIIDSLYSGQILLTPYILSSDPHAGELYALFDRMYETYQKLLAAEEIMESAAQTFSLVSELNQLMSILLSSFIAPAGNEEKSRDLKFITSVAQYIDQHYTEPISSRSISSVYNYEPTYFCKLFKRSFGITFTEYLNGYRVWNSTFYRRSPDMPLYQIAAAVGFRSYYHFSHCFTAISGMTPREFFSK